MSACRRKSSTCSSKLQRDLGLSYLFITHNLGVVEHIADNAAVMLAGRIVEQGPAAAVPQRVQRPQHGYTPTLLAAAAATGRVGDAVIPAHLLH